MQFTKFNTLISSDILLEFTLKLWKRVSLVNNFETQAIVLSLIKETELIRIMGIANYNNLILCFQLVFR